MHTNLVATLVVVDTPVARKFAAHTYKTQENAKSVAERVERRKVAWPARGHARMNMLVHRHMH